MFCIPYLLEYNAYNFVGNPMFFEFKIRRSSTMPNT